MMDANLVISATLTNPGTSNTIRIAIKRHGHKYMTEYQVRDDGGAHTAIPRRVKYTSYEQAFEAMRTNVRKLESSGWKCHSNHVPL